MDTASLVRGDATPLETIASSSGGGDGDGGDGPEPPLALSWGRPDPQSPGDDLLLVVRPDRTAAVVRISCAAGAGAGRGGSPSSFSVREVADGRQAFTAGCFLRQGRGRLALGTYSGEVEVYGCGEAVGGGGLASPEGVAPRPSELSTEGEPEVRLSLQTV